MSTPSLSGGFERFSSRADVSGAIVALDEDLASLNETLSYTSLSYDSAVVYALDADMPVATPLATSDAYGSTPRRHHFRDDYIMNRRLLTPGTALGDALSSAKKADTLGRKEEPQYLSSRINKEYDQLTYTKRLTFGREVVGAVQYSFTAPEQRGAIEHLPSPEELDDAWDKHAKEMAHLALTLDALQRLARETEAPLAAGLELEDPLAPNAFLIRWDVEGATAMAKGPKKTAFRAYLNAVRSQLKTLTERYADTPELSHWNIRSVFDDQGDGSYLILPIAEHFNTYDAQYLKDYKAYTAPRFMREMRAAIEEVGAAFTDLQPKVHLSGDFGYAEGNSAKRLDSYLMYALAAQQKEK